MALAGKGDLVRLLLRVIGLTSLAFLLRGLFALSAGPDEPPDLLAEISEKPIDLGARLEPSYTPVDISRPSIHLQRGSDASRIAKVGAERQAAVVVNSSSQYQTMEGFGATHVTLSSLTRDDLSPALRVQAVDTVYGQVRLTTGNVEVGVIEAPANATDLGEQQANDDDDPFHFNWQGFNFRGSDMAKQKLLDLARPKGFDDFYLGMRATVRWANKWMKTIRAIDYNRYLDEWGEQVAAGMIHWRDAYGVVPKYLQLFNEPTSGNQELDPGSTQEEIEIIKRVGGRLRREGFETVKFVVPGEETEQRSLDVAKAILADSAARQYVGAIAYHPYPYGSTYCDVSKILHTSGRGEPDPEKVAVRHELRDLGKKYGVPLWMTEVSHGAVPPLSFDDLLGRALHIHDELVYADAAAYFGMGNMVDRNSLRGRDPFSEEGNIVIVDPLAKKVYITGMGYAIGHYARWVPRGSIRIEANSTDPLLIVTAFWYDAERRLVLVLINSDEGQSMRVDLQLNGSAKNDLLKFIGEQSTARGAWAPVDAFLPKQPSGVSLFLPPRSVTTITGQPGKPRVLDSGELVPTPREATSDFMPSGSHKGEIEDGKNDGCEARGPCVKNPSTE
jgi:O-glycosyl hydrolase